MDRTSIIGIVLIMLLFLAWQYVAAPSAAEIEMEQRYQDSIAALSEAELRAGEELPAQTDVASPAELSDSLRQVQYGSRFGAFATAAAGTAQDIVIENDLMKVTFSTKGGTIRQAELKNYAKVVEREGKEELHLPLLLLEDEKNKFEYIIPVNGVAGDGVRTSDLYFTPTVEGETLTMRAPVEGGGYFEQRYTLTDGTYLIDYDIRFEGLNTVMANTDGTVRLHWENHLDKIEKNSQYEASYSTLYYKPVDDDTDYCSCTSDDTETLDDQPLKWVAGSQQFFTSALIADDRFSSAVLTTVADEDRLSDDELKLLVSDLNLPIGSSASETFGMSFYVGPNEFERLRAIGYDLSDVVSFGSSIFGTINRWVIRPLFNFLSGFIGNMGIAILVLTLLVKMLVYPLTYKMLVSNQKMQVLKPEIEKIKAKHKDDSQSAQVETMKLYQEYGASPLGGCLPMVLQMPIWFALYRFFPASITFRQENFLWANDLSTYDSIMRLPEWIPFMQGHLSLFAVLWAITTVIYAYYNSRHMDYSAQPMMKYFQYIMPVMFLGFFNSFAAGLTCYLFFSNVFNIAQTLVTKNFIIDDDKLRAKLNANKEKPKKKGGFSARLQEALKEQQRQQSSAQSKKK
ncbi:YidC/Oxa1 family membrane protein insertase [Lewinella aquimaris]|uniref:Membrane protein insertase YidC n=1 Tax=Neolewinella aquimaris TaxID=1835722 RepID=A0A840E4G4_9BACT|nr:membrane protein insertase YidC [Neolewinella aquimaris]MBB4078555.1 YidC/Oxa1 family membrane protein insertase [Neolewinella aquimaris]